MASDSSTITLLARCCIAFGIFGAPGSPLVFCAFRSRLISISGRSISSAISRELIVTVESPARRVGERRVGDAIGMELLVDIALQAHRLHALDVAGPGAEADTVQHVGDRRLVVGKRRRVRVPLSGAGGTAERQQRVRARH